MAQTTLDAESKAHAKKDTASIKAKEEEFIKSCRPLKEMLDSVRDIEGFPTGKDEDILALSDAPWYTACPNPYINDFIETYGKLYDETTDTYDCTPFISDVSEGKSDPIYNAHSYHTKVPHKAIMKFIEHYTKEGDIVFDGFCGTGMTGIAAQLLNRRAVLCDLSPAATFIAHNYNTPVNTHEFEREAKRILVEVEKECGWMYETLHNDDKTRGRINYTIWSDVFICPYCNNEFVFWGAAVDKENSKINEKFLCPHCNATTKKTECDRAQVSYFDSAINQQITQAKQVPVLINYSVGKKRYEKTPDQYDLNLIKKMEVMAIPYWFPTNRMPDGYNTKQPLISHGVTHVHHFYTKRNLWILAAIYSRIQEIKNKSVLNKIYFAFNNVQQRHCRMNTFRFNVSFPSNITTGTLYVASLMKETNFFDQFRNKIFKRLIPIFEDNNFSFDNVIIECSNTASVNVSSNSIDYIFTDPPFGSNLMYSELNYLWESWLKVFTNNNSEAIINDVQLKGFTEYKELMISNFKKMYHVLKPNRWITVEFHNSQASVWNAIQDAITKAGFIVAQVTVLDKKQGSFKQVTSSGAVKNDLIINAYKPKQRFEELFLKQAGVGLERDFIEQHLNHLVVEPNIERSEQMLFSKMLAHYVQHGYEIKLNAKQFYTLLRDNFKLMDGFWFTDAQITEYDEWKKDHGLQAIEEIAKGQQTLFVNDERSALIWLYNFLNNPKTYSDILTAYNQVTTNIEDDIPELKNLLETNFVFENGMYRRPLTEKEKEEKEEQSEKELLKAFDKVLAEASTGTKKIKIVRKEALIIGFTKAYQEKRFQDIIMVADKLKADILENNSEINDFVEIARLKLGDEI